MEKENKVLFNFRIHKELYDFLSETSKQRYTTMSQYLTDIITKDKDNTQGEYYVYVYLDPRKKGDFVYDDISFEYEPFYVGKGKGNRIEQSIYDNNNNLNKKHTISEIFNSGLKPISLKIYDNISNEKSYELEREIIQKIGRLNENSVLTNVTKGSTSNKKSISINRNFKIRSNNATVFASYFSDGKYELKDGSLINEKLFLDLFEAADEELYYLRENENYVVSITDRDDTYFELSDGSKIPQILFYQTFKQVEKVDPNKFFGVNKTPVEKMQELGRETLQQRSIPHIRQIKIEEIQPEPQVTKGPSPNNRI